MFVMSLIVFVFGILTFLEAIGRMYKEGGGKGKEGVGHEVGRRAGRRGLVLTFVGIIGAFLIDWDMIPWIM